MVNTNSNDMIDFSASVRNFAERKICLQPQRLQIHLPNAKEVMNAGLQHFLGGDYKWQPEYDKDLGCSAWATAVGERPPFAYRYFHASCNTIFTKLWQCVWRVR